jgi:hypothetical protein
MRPSFWIAVGSVPKQFLDFIAHAPLFRHLDGHAATRYPWKMAGFRPNFLISSLDRSNQGFKRPHARYSPRAFCPYYGVPHMTAHRACARAVAKILCGKSPLS